MSVCVSPVLSIKPPVETLLPDFHARSRGHTIHLALHTHGRAPSGELEGGSGVGLTRRRSDLQRGASRCCRGSRAGRASETLHIPEG